MSTAAILILSAGCGPDRPETGQDHLLQATLWYQRSAEMSALYYQAFNWAGRVLEWKISEYTDQSLAVVLDIDETVLDNSPQTAQQIIDGEAYNQKMWDEWCMLAKAEPLPGALTFTRLAEKKGVEVYYISNRRIHLLDATLKNLRDTGFPFADSLHLLLREESSDKEPRREKVMQTHRVVLLIGDNLDDFSGIFNDRNRGNAVKLVEEQKERFGFEYILLPNPMYGNWEKPFRGENLKEENRKKREALRSFRH